MTQRTTDTGFDFFDDETVEATGASRRARGPRSRRPGGPPTGLTPLLRLVGLVAFAIAIIVFLVLWAESCRSEDQRDAYQEYIEQMSGVARDSERVGRELNTALTTPGIQLTDLQQTIGGLAQQQAQGVARARAIEPPGRLRLQHQQAIEALEFRVSGLQRLQDAFTRAENAEGSTEAGRLLAEQMRRLAASDIIWSDLFRESTVQVLSAQEIGAPVPNSQFLANAEMASESFMTPIWNRISGAATGGTPTGLHGNSLVGVRVMPADEELKADGDNIVTATADLRFEATVENSGEHQEVQVEVTLRIQQSPRPIEKRQTIDLINPGEQKTVTFGNLPAPNFDAKTTLRVEVARVPGEENLTNNAATYPIIFTLTPPS